ncbi:MAG TPA: NAD(P)/FAD-dependent oxidoreductase [Anaerolineae bacterium]|nr:NAD(P)/FAD-dependent oxidoreductase [Anaerolineae bacterium]
MIKHRVIVVGGGASGLMAAGQAAASGAETILLEKMDRPGRKLSITGKGRCNLTNIATIDDFIAHFGRNGRFLRRAFARFFSHELMTFLEARGVQTVTERGGRVFPASGDAHQIVEALVSWGREVGVRMATGVRVERLVVEKGRVSGVMLAAVPAGGLAAAERADRSKRMQPADAVILATGGASYPATGSTGDGYRMAEEVGHTLVPIRPALVPLETDGNTASKLQGLSLRNVSVSLVFDGRKGAQAFGEMLFTHFGVSGPIILTLSRRVVDALREGRQVAISIDLKPALDEKKLDARLLRDLDAYGKRHFRTLLKGLLPHKLIPVCVEQTKIAADRRAHQLTSDERRRLRDWLKDFRLLVTGHRPLAAAIITAGGVSTREVDPRSMASRLVKGLYFAGEVLDIDADTGGYNLQAAFSTGWVAGRSAALGET